ARAKNRDSISRNGNYVEVYISTPIAVCMKRDVKSIYKKAGKGLMKGITGLDDPYEPPKHPEITIDTTKMTPQQSVKVILDYLTKNNLISLHH
ncbi:MAG TPA: adenylyl-sulfate kinase, partial [Patescibacteria group bacterium]|nr:adenylyl-sulfate kinase [Patescibacteria group bacterium]